MIIQLCYLDVADNLERSVKGDTGMVGAALSRECIAHEHELRGVAS